MNHRTYHLLAACWLFSFIPGLCAQPGTVTQPAVIAAQPFALGEVRLLESPFKKAMERNASYLLSLEPDRLLHNTRLYARLAPKGECYGGWESTGCAGHTLGHYLTAISQQYAATGDMRFRKRIDYIVSEMAECQKAYGDGYIGAMQPPQIEILRGFGKGKLEMDGLHAFKGSVWPPWYIEHKVLNGLKDAWILGGNEQARNVALRLADWVGEMTAGLNPGQLQVMLEVEQGGMMDALAELYGLTGNPRYLESSRRFYHKAVFEPLLAQRDELAGLHANTQIPKIVGEARIYEVTGDPQSRRIAEYFWGSVAHHHSYVIGGDSDDEHFFDERTTPKHIDYCTAETCNTYNMLKLTEHLLSWEPKADYADFYERALYNHILASQEPGLGMFTYFMTLEPGLYKTYSTPFDSFWCCVGTGMENHTKYGHAIYSHGVDDLYVNLFIPSIVSWKQKGFVLSQETDYPRSDKTRLTVMSDPAEPIALRVRCPEWTAGSVIFEINGSRIPIGGTPGSYAEVRRIWKKGDRLTVTIPMAVRTEAMPGAPNKVAFLYGPVVLAGDLGPVPKTNTVPYSDNPRVNKDGMRALVPALSRRGGPLESKVIRSAGDSLTFRTEGLGRPTDVILRPFWEISYNHSTVYWDVVAENQ